MCMIFSVKTQGYPQILEKLPPLNKIDIAYHEYILQLFH